MIARTKIIAILLPIILGIPITLGYVVTTTKYHMVVIEPLVIVPVESLDLNLYPAGTIQRSVIVENVGSDPINVSWVVGVFGPSPQFVTVTTDPVAFVIIPAQTNVTLVLTITTTSAIASGDYSIEIQWSR